MRVVYIAPNPSGAYPPIQEGVFETCPEGMAEWPEELSAETFCRYNGFVTLTVENGKVTDCQPNTEAWEQWRAEHPAPDPGQSLTEVTMEDVAVTMLDHETRLMMLEMAGGESV